MSFNPHAYVDAAATAIDLVVPPDARDAVAANLARLHSLAQQVMAFNLKRASKPEPHYDD